MNEQRLTLGIVTVVSAITLFSLLLDFGAVTLVLGVLVGLVVIPLLEEVDTASISRQ